MTQEGFYVLEGTLTLQLGNQTIKAPPGSYAYVPTGVVHGFSNPENVPAKFLTFISPAGFESYFEELAELIKNQTTWPPTDMSKVAALAAKYDTYPPAAKE